MNSRDLEFLGDFPGEFLGNCYSVIFWVTAMQLMAVVVVEAEGGKVDAGDSRGGRQRGRWCRWGRRRREFKLMGERAKERKGR